MDISLKRNIRRKKAKMETEKSIEDYTEDEIKEIFLDLFFWVSENRPSWLQEAIDRKKRMLGRSE